MYGLKNYISRGTKFANNTLFPSNKKLATLMIYATDLCDLGCKHCLIWAKRPAISLPFEKIKEIMASKCVTSDTMGGLEGGEFLLHPDAEKILKWFKENHPNFDLLTNCLVPDNAIRLIRMYPPKRVYLSLDGTKDTYKYMRGKDGYDSVLKVIEGIKDIVPVSTMFTLSPYNSFDDMRHVAELCKGYGIDMRVGVYNDIAYFDTVEKAHETDINFIKDEKKTSYQDVRDNLKPIIEDKSAKLSVLEKENIEEPKHDPLKLKDDAFKYAIPEIIKEFKENYDFLVLYDEWRKKKLKLKCYSILDSLVILPNGDVPICQNLDLMLGNVHKQSLDEVFNGKSTIETHKEYVHNCNQCWLNFHRKYDIVLYRTMEKVFPKSIVSKMFGYYQWEEDKTETYSGYMKKIHEQFGKVEGK